MARHWIRDAFAYNTGNYYGARFMKQLTTWLINVLGYTFQSQSIGGSGSFITTEKSSTGGTASFSGSSWTLSDSSAPFVQADTGKWICIYDATHPENSGIYRLQDFLTTSTIRVDFACEPTQYPTVSTGIKWWLAAYDYQVPNTNSDYVRLQSPHSTGWAIELKIQDVHVIARVAVDGNWSGSKILGSGNCYTYLSSVISRYSYYSVVGTTDGKELVIATYDRAADSTRNQLSIISEITPIEAGLPAIDLIGLAGSWEDVSVADTAARNTDAQYTGTVGVWSSRANAGQLVYMVGYTSGGNANSLTGLTTRERNPRIGNKNECMYGTPLCLDYNNTSGRYQLLGSLGGHWTTRGSLPRTQPMTSDGTKRDRLHVWDGFVIQWPEQFTPFEA